MILELSDGENSTGRPLETSYGSWMTLLGHVLFSGLDMVSPPPRPRSTGKM